MVSIHPFGEYSSPVQTLKCANSIHSTTWLTFQKILQRKGLDKTSFPNEFGPNNHSQVWELMLECLNIVAEVPTSLCAKILHQVAEQTICVFEIAHHHDSIQCSSKCCCDVIVSLHPNLFLLITFPKIHFINSFPSNRLLPITI